MSQKFLKDFLRDKEHGNYFFSAIKQEWAKQSLEKSRDYKYKGRLNPSSSWMTWGGCPYLGIREQAAGREAKEASSIIYMEVGNYYHEGFLREASRIKDLLWPKPVFPTKEANDKLEQHWPEVPIFWEEYLLSARVDTILNIKEEPAVLDLKIPQCNEERWKKLKPTYPETTHLCQSALGALALKRMDILNPTRVGVLYFNPTINPRGDDNYKECYADFDQEMEDKTMYLLQHAHEELLTFLAGEDKGCRYPGCKVHQ